MVLRTIGPMEPLHPGFAYFPLKSRQGFRELDPRFRYQMYQLLARTHIKRNQYISHAPTSLELTLEILFLGISEIELLPFNLQRLRKLEGTYDASFLNQENPGSSGEHLNEMLYSSKCALGADLLHSSSSRPDPHLPQ